MFKRLLPVLLLMMISASPVNACVGRILNVGMVDTPAGRVMAETIALMITERTGTTVNTNYFSTAEELYNEVRQEKIGIIVENTSRALEVLGLEKDPDHEQAYLRAKEGYRKEMNLIWLTPFKFVHSVDPDRKTAVAVVLSLQVMTDFPGLQRLLNKLAAKMDDPDYARLLEQVNAGVKPARAARDFLEMKKLI